MYGTQTMLCQFLPLSVFENDVKMYGTQTAYGVSWEELKFENDVKMYGTQTTESIQKKLEGLRMM